VEGLSFVQPRGKLTLSVGQTGLALSKPGAPSPDISIAFSNIRCANRSCARHGPFAVTIMLVLVRVLMVLLVLARLSLTIP